MADEDKPVVTATPVVDPAPASEENVAPAAEVAVEAAPAAVAVMAQVLASPVIPAAEATPDGESNFESDEAPAVDASEDSGATTAPVEPPAAPVEDQACEAVAAVEISDPDPNSFQALLNPPAPTADAPAQVSMGSSREKSSSVNADSASSLGEGAPLDGEEIRVLGEIREKGGPEIEEMSNELLTRCLRGYAGYPDRVGDTTAAILKIVRWRREQGMGDILGKQLEHHNEFNKNWPCMLCGWDREGHLIQYENLKTMNTALLAKNIDNGTVPLASLVRQRAQVYEAVDEYKRKQGAKRAGAGSPHGRRYKAVYIFDLQGFSYGLLTKKIREIIKSVIGIGGEMFPEAMATMYLINAPMTFRAAWSLIKPWLHPITQKKIFLLGNQSKYMPVMEAAGLLRSQLPTVMGGTHPGVMCVDLVQQSESEST